MKKYHTIENVHFVEQTIVVTIDGDKKQFDLEEISSLLLNATERERNHFEISQSGYGIHWPLLDEDLSIDGLLGIIHQPEWKQKIATNQDRLCETTI